MGATGSKSKKKSPLLDKTIEELNEFKGYVATDAGQFKKFASAEALQRTQDWTRSHTPPAQPPALKWSVQYLKQTHDQVVRDRAGACAQLGAAGAYRLWKMRDRKKLDERIDVVSFAVQGARVTPHVLAVVGRAGGEDDGPDDWGSHWWLVDPWMGAMGKSVVYDGVTNYPFAGQVRDGAVETHLTL